MCIGQNILENARKIKNKAHKNVGIERFTLDQTLLFCLLNTCCFLFEMTEKCKDFVSSDTGLFNYAKFVIVD